MVALINSDDNSDDHNAAGGVGSWTRKERLWFSRLGDPEIKILWACFAALKPRQVGP